MTSQPLLEVQQVRPNGSLSVTADALILATESGTAELDIDSIVSYQQTHKSFPLETLGLATIAVMGATAVGMMLYFPMKVFFGLTLIVGLGLIFATLYFYQDYSEFTELTFQTESESFTVYVTKEDSRDINATVETQLTSTN